MIIQNSSVYHDGSLTSFRSEVVEHGEKVFELKSMVNYGNEQESIAAAAQFWANYPQTSEDLRLYLDKYKMEVQILGMVQ